MVSIKLNKPLVIAFVLIVIALALFIMGPVLFGPKFFLKAPVTAAQSSGCPAANVSGFAWSSNVGWIQMSGTAQDGSAYGVYMNPVGGALCGYAWSSNIGWVSFNIPTMANGCLSFPESPKVPAYLDATSGILQGWAETVAGKGATTCGGPSAGGWDGWIKMSSDQTASAYGVKFDKTAGNLSGFAWGGDVIGWIDFGGVSVAAQGTTVSCASNPAQCFPGICGPNGQCSYSCTPTSGCSSGAVCSGGVCINSCKSNSAICFPGTCLANGQCSNVCSGNSDCLSGQCVNGTCVQPEGNAPPLPGGIPGVGPISGGEVSGFINNVVNGVDTVSAIVNTGVDGLINTIVSGTVISDQTQACKDLNLKISWDTAPALNKEVTFTGSSNDNPGIHTWVWMFKSDIILPVGTTDTPLHTATVKFISANTGFGNKSTVVLGVKHGSDTCYASRVLFVGGRTEQ